MVSTEITSVEQPMDIVLYNSNANGVSKVVLTGAIYLPTRLGYGRSSIMSICMYKSDNNKPTAYEQSVYPPTSPHILFHQPPQVRSPRKKKKP